MDENHNVFCSSVFISESHDSQRVVRSVSQQSSQLELSQIAAAVAGVQSPGSQHGSQCLNASEESLITVSKRKYTTELSPQKTTPETPNKIAISQRSMPSLRSQLFFDDDIPGTLPTDTLEPESFDASSNRPRKQYWGKLISLNNQYPNIDLADERKYVLSCLVVVVFTLS